MAFLRSSLSELRDQTRSAIRSRLGVGPFLVRSVLGAIADSVAAVAHHILGYMDWIFAQAFPDTAEATELDRHASRWGVTRAPATYSSGSISISATVGTVIPAGTRWRRSDGTEFELDGLGVITVTSPQTLSVEATDPGVVGNCDSGTEMIVTTPISGLIATATASGDIEGGADEESDAALRARVLDRMRLAPQGGAEADYVLWATSIPDVTRAWVTNAVYGAGTVLVQIATDNLSTPIPTAAKVAEVQAYIDGVRPLTADPTVAAPTEAPLALNITLTPDTPEVRDAVEQSLTDYLRREAAPGATFYLSQIQEAISIAAGEMNHVLVSPVADVVAGDDELTTLGTITWS